MDNYTFIGICGRLLFVLGLLGPFSAYALQQQFQASMEESTWRVEAARNHCSLSHVIPRFGVARFSQASRKRLQFEIDTAQPPVNAQSVRIVSMLPPWKYGEAETHLGYVELASKKTPLHLPRKQALRLYYELEQGRMPALLFDDWADGADQVEVRLSPVRFRESLQEFQACTDQLIYLDFDPLSEQIIKFSTNSTALKLEARNLLQQVAREFRQQPGVRIILGGHTDERGTEGYNLNLSKNRAAFVARYLRSRGVPAGAIEQRFFGESQPVNEQSSQEAWAKNRRVMVWITK